MDFADAIITLSTQIKNVPQHSLETEEGTKMALILPFIQTLGYNFMDPSEVIPEYTSDYGMKKGEKVDYAIIKNGKPIMLFECKCCGVNLDITKESQLSRYFANSDARIAILTDGREYRFYTDLEKPNVMDHRPFMVFDATQIDESYIPDLKKLSKDNFNIEDTLSTAEELKYVRAIKRLLAAELEEPSDGFITFIGREIYSGKLTTKAKEQLRGPVKKAFNDFIINRLKDDFESFVAAKTPVEEQTPEEPKNKGTTVPENKTESKVITTKEETQGFYIVQAIMSQVVEPKRVIMRDTQSYCGILLDDNNRKPICRLRFDYATMKKIGLFDAEKNEDIVDISTLEDIYKYADKLRQVVAYYDKN